MLLIAATSVAACMPSEPAATTAEILARNAEPLLNLCQTTQVIDQSRWPASLINFGVESVHIRQEGLYIETDRVFVMETGVFIPCDRVKFIPTKGGDPSFTKIADGVFTYYVAG